MDKIIPTGGEYPLSVNYADRSLSEEQLLWQEPFDNDQENSSNANCQSNNSTVESIESYVSVSTSDNSIFDLDVRNCSPNEANNHSNQIIEISLSPLPPLPPDVASVPQTSAPVEQSISSVHNPVLRVTFRGVPPNIDIMSFSFLKTFGTVLEGRMVEDTLNLYSPDGTCCLTPVYTGVVIFTIFTHSLLSAENLMILNGSIGSLIEHTFLFHMFSHAL